MARQTIALSRSCFIVQKYISPCDKQKTPHLCLNFENPCWTQAPLASCWMKNPNLAYFSRTASVASLRAAQPCLPAHAPLKPCPGTRRLSTTASLCLRPRGQGDTGRAFLTGIYLYLLSIYSSPLLIDGGASCGCEPGTKQCTKTIYWSWN